MISKKVFVLRRLKVYHSSMRYPVNEKYRYIWLLACLGLYLVNPIYRELDLPGHAFTGSLLYSCILFTALRSCLDNKKLLVWMILLSSPAFLAHWANITNLYHSANLLLWASILFNISFCCIITKEMLSPECSIHNRLAASLCNYLFIGITFTYLFSLIEIHFPGSFKFPMEMALEPTSAGISQLLGAMNYHSFVTLATLGYGDIHPLTPISRCACIIEAIIGQLYLIVVVTSVVGGNITQVFHKESN